jgi:hypothetical protein
VTLTGWAPWGSLVTVSRSDLGVIGTTTADEWGDWTFDYTGTTLAEGTYTFTATATVDGLTSAASDPLVLTVDQTAPAVTVSGPTDGAGLPVTVGVTASDAGGLPDWTPVSVDVDLNGDGSFGGPGEANYATGYLVGGSASVPLPGLPGGTSYAVQARVADRAGNEGTSAPVTVTTLGQGGDDVGRQGASPGAQGR